MENSIVVEKSIEILDVRFNKVIYEVQVVDGEIGSMFRADNFEIEKEEREALENYIYSSLK